MRVVLLSEYPIEDGTPFTGSHLQTFYVGKVVSEVCDCVLLAFHRRGGERTEGRLRIRLLKPSRWEIVRLWRLLRASLDEGPKVVYVRGRSYHLMVALLLKLLKGSKVVWSINAQEGHRDFKHVRNLLRSRRPFLRKLLLLPLFFALDLSVAMGMRVADVITVQNRPQLSAVRRKFPGKRSLLLPNLQEVPKPDGEVPIPPPYFVWASARSSPTKRPEVFLEIARRLPEYRFVMVGYGGRGPENVVVLPRLPRGKLHALLKGATAVVITSAPESEGIPNLAIEAMLLGTPVVSLGDDFGFLHRGGGVVVDGVEAAAAVLRRMVSEKTFTERLSGEAKRLAYETFVLDSHRRWREFWLSFKMEAC